MLQKMKSIHVLQKQLDTVRQHLKLPSVEAAIKPVFHDQQWLLSTDICIILARRLAQSPEVIANSFLEHLGAVSEGGWQRVAGYLVLQVSKELELIADYQSAYEGPEKVRIIVPGRAKGHSVPSYLRLTALALLEGIWAHRRQVSIDLIIADQSFTEQLRLGQITSILDQVVLLSSSQQLAKDQITNLSLDQLRCDPTSRYSFFLLPGEIDPSFFKKGAAILPFDEKVSVTIPERGWVADVDALPESFSYLDKIQDAAYSLLLHLASDSRGVDIEWSAPTFQERKNLCWLLKTVLTRFENLSKMYLDSKAVDPLALKEPFEGHYGFILRYLPLFFERAIYHGEVMQLVAAAGEACNYLSSTLNRADFRIGLEKGADRALSQLAALKPLGGILDRLFFHVD
jgi:hypothetical protein